MSTFIGKVGGKPFMHMTSDVKTEAAMQGAPSSTTLFHSSLPYVFAREQWEITSYTDWNGTGGGRKFALPADAQTFKAANPDLAYIVIVEDSNGHTTIINPSLNITSAWLRNYNGSIVGGYNAATIGAEYSFAFTDSDTQLADLTRNTISRTTRTETFRMWDSNDTSITIFRHPNTGTAYKYSQYFDDYACAAKPNFANSFGLGSFRDTLFGPAKDAVSVSLDIVKVRIVVLNVLNSASSFEVQAGYDDTAGITISNDEFSVGGINLLESAPIISRGTQNAGTTVTPIYGKPIGNKVNGVNTSTKTSGKVNASNVVQDNNTPILEIPSPVPATPSAIFDFENQTFSINGDTVFSSSGTAQGLVATGYKTVTFDMAFSTPASNTNRTVAMTSTSTGSFGTVDANTMYLLAFKFGESSGENIMTPVSLIGVGDNEIFNDWFAMEDILSPLYFQILYSFFLTIDSSGNVSVSRREIFNYVNASLSFNWGSIEARLIALNPA